MKCEEEFDRGKSRGGAVEAQGRSPKVKRCRRFSSFGGLRACKREVALGLERQGRSRLGKSLCLLQ